MQGKVGGTLDSLVRTQGFLDANATLLAAVNQSSARKALDTSIANLKAQRDAQEVAKEEGKGETNKHKGLKVLLRRQMFAVASVARGNPGGIDELRTMRQSPSNASLQAHLARANAMAKAVDDNAALFTAGGLSPDFMTSFRATIASVDGMIGTRNDKGSARVQATEATLGFARAGRQAIRVLDGLVRLQAAGDAVLLAGWASAKRVYRLRGSASSAPKVTPTPVATNTPTAATPAAARPVAATPVKTEVATPTAA